MVIIPVINLDFTVDFKRDIIFERSKLTYFTYLYDVVEENITNETIFSNEMHKVTVEGFDGIFIFMRARPFRPIRHRPAQFMFAGTYENVTVLN
jgi:hypothetical protein